LDAGDKKLARAQFTYLFTVDANAGAPDDDEEEEEEVVGTINGRIPINSKHAGGEHPSGVDFSKKGFPNFRPYAVAQVEVEGLTGKYDEDAAMANQAAGLAKTPDGLVWHHVEDGKTMQLVPQDIHDAARHTGGAAIIRNGGTDQ
jgi:hypothetical protein